MTDWVQKIYLEWFGDSNPSPEGRSIWWRSSPEFDESLRVTFLRFQRELISGKHRQYLVTPQGRLAMIIAIDQFSRNMFRGKPEAFENDHLALSFAEDGLRLRDDRKLSLIERVFFYLPFEHSENIEVQERSVQLFQSLLQEAPEDKKASYEDNLLYAKRHHEIIQRFGRFPHRNTILGRSSSPEEIEFLKEPMSSF